MTPQTPSDARWSEVVRNRRMSRAFHTTAVGRPLLERLVADAARAPSAGKTQGWHAVVLEHPDTHKYWDSTLPTDRRDGFRWPQLLDAPVIMVILSDPNAYVRRYAEADKARTGLGAAVEAWPAPYWTIDASMAAMTLLLGAEANGLGALFFGVFSGERELRHTLGIPDELEIVGTIALGYPLDAPRGRSASRPTRTPDEIVHYGAW